MKSMNTKKVLVLSLVSLISFSSAVQAVRFVPSIPSREQMKNVAHMVAVRPVVGTYNVVRHPVDTTKAVASFSAKFVPSMSSVKNVAFMIAIQPFLSAYNVVRHPVNTGSAVLRGGKTAATTVVSPFTRLWSYMLSKKAAPVLEEVVGQPENLLAEQTTEELPTL